MKKERENLELLLICMVIGIIAACITGYFLYENKKEYWEVQARDTFDEALTEEMQKRSGMEVFFCTEGNIHMPVDKKKEPITVFMETEYGKKNFVIPYEKHTHNIIRSSDQRMLYTYLLYKDPLKADSLNMIWSDLLAKVKFPGKTIVRVSVTDWWEHETNSYSNDLSYLSKSDSLVSCYLGYRCEVGVTGFTYSAWWKVLTLKDKILLGALVVASLLLFFVQEFMIRIYRRLFIKEIPVIAMDKSQSHIYQLEDDCFFDAGSMNLKSSAVNVKLTPLPATLLQGFLDAQDNKLSINEIMMLLWPDGTGTSERVHTTIRRLRKYLSEIDWVVENGNSAYQLKNRHSIEEKLEK